MQTELRRCCCPRRPLHERRETSGRAAWKPKHHVLYVILSGSFNLATLDEGEPCKPPIRRQPTETTRQFIERAAEAEPKLAVATEALKWLQANASELRNQRIAPLADAAREIWRALRQESNVDLGAIRLEGQKTSRRVLLKADVDGSDTEAFGVMSQGELQALALAIFIPRATSAESPFRFLVLDDLPGRRRRQRSDGWLWR